MSAGGTYQINSPYAVSSSWDVEFPFYYYLTNSIQTFHEGSQQLSSGLVIGAFSPTYVQTLLALPGYQPGPMSMMPPTGGTNGASVVAMQGGGLQTPVATIGPNGRLNVLSNSKLTVTQSLEVWGTNQGYIDPAFGILDIAGGGILGTAATQGSNVLDVAQYAELLVHGSTANVAVTGSVNIDGSASVSLGGSLSITSTSTSLVIGNGGVSPNFTVTGADAGAGNLPSCVTTNAGITIGRSISASMTVRAGGIVHNGTGGVFVIAPLNGASSSALVTGSGSALSSDAQIQVGAGNIGTFTIADHAIVSSKVGPSTSGTSALIAAAVAANGSNATVSGGAQWNQDGGMNVGFGGRGTVNVTTGGIINSLLGFVGRNAGSDSSSASLTDSGSAWHVSNALYVGGSSTAAGGTASLKVSNGAIVTATQLIDWAGSTVDPSASGFITVGSVATPISGATVVGPGGTVGGDGPFLGSLINSGGTVSPGHSPGTLMVSGDYTQSADGILLIEIAGTGLGMFDKLSVSGTATLDGTVDFVFLSGFQPGSGGQFQFFNSAVRSGQFAHYIVTGLPFGDTFQPDLAGGAFTITAIPEPASVGVLGIAAMGLLIRRRRQAQGN
jgi:T5SS/PEP-CTERM-associated repeat protein